MISSFWCSSGDTQRLTPLSDRKMTPGDTKRGEFWTQEMTKSPTETNAQTEKSTQNLQTWSFTFTPTPTQTRAHRPERWSREQRVFLTRASLVYSEAQCFSRTLIALTGGIPDGLLHCLHAAAHSSEDKSLSAVHHRLRWKNWVKIPRCTSECSFYSKKLQEWYVFRHMCDGRCLCLFISFHYYYILCSFVCFCSSFIQFSLLTSISNFISLCLFYLFLNGSVFLILSVPQQIRFWWLTAEKSIIKEGPAALTLQNHFLLTQPRK